MKDSQRLKIRSSIFAAALEGYVALDSGILYWTQIQISKFMAFAMLALRLTYPKENRVPAGYFV